MTGILKKIRRGEEPHDDSDHVVIENAGRREYRISGSSVANHAPVRFASHGFADLSAAIEVAMDWAETHKIEYVHVIASED